MTGSPSADKAAADPEASARKVREAAEAHMGAVPKEERAQKSAEAEAQAADAHLELTHHKHSKGRPPPGNEALQGNEK